MKFWKVNLFGQLSSAKNRVVKHWTVEPGNLEEMVGTLFMQSYKVTFPQ